jgi:hypothetical protein
MVSPKTKLALFIAFRGGLQIALTIPIVAVLRAIVGRIFESDWNIDWGLLATMTSVFAGGWFVFSFVTQVMDDRAEEQREQATGHLRFPGETWIRAVYSATMLMGVGLAIGTYREGDPLWMSVLSLGFVAMGLIGWPHAVEFRDGEIRQRSRFFRVKAIPYVAIKSAASSPSTGETLVFGQDGTIITHTKEHASRIQFIDYLKQVTGKGVIILS